MHTCLKPLAALLPLLFISAPALAQTTAHAQHGEVVVTATRFHDFTAALATNVTTLTHDDIQASGARTLPDVLKYQAGLNISPLYGSIGADTAIDMRGFGEGATSRTLVLFNGQRLNALDNVNVDWGLVPLESIERIEIIHGSGSVLYGDNAVGGVINIITGKQKEGGHILIGAGSQNSRQFTAGLSKQMGAINLNLTANHQDADGWRQNNKQKRDNLSGRVATNFGHGEAYVDLGWSALKTGLPGSLTQARYDSNPKQAQTTDSTSERRNTYVRPGFAIQLADTLKLATEIGYSKSENTSYISNWCSWGSCFDNRTTDIWSFTPRLQWQHGLGGIASKTTFGLDYHDGDLSVNKSASNHGSIINTIKIKQKSQAFYLQNQTDLLNNLSLTLGARHQQIDQSATDTTGARISNDHSKNIGELGLSYQFSAGTRVFSKVGSTFRNANLDELTTFAGFASKPVRPEQGRSIDAGIEFKDTAYTLRLTAYHLRMKDEITYNSVTFENENMAKTRHEGIDLSGHYNLNTQWQFTGGLNLQKAKFSDGVDNGKKIPLVPAVKVTAGIRFKPTAALNLSLLTNHIGERISGGDTSNTLFPVLAAYTTADFVVSWHQAQWTTRARVINLTDKKYAASAYYGSYYPADGRAFFADLRYDF